MSVAWHGCTGTMKKFFVALCFALASSPGLACECSFGPLDDQAIDGAKHVFAFRLLSVAIDQPGASPDEVLYEAVGKIEVTETLRGNGSQFRRVRFTTFQCCGTRLDVGHVYFAFVSNDGPEFDGNIGSLLAERSNLDDVLAGKAKLRKGALDASSSRISEIPPPPAPCLQKK